MTSPVSPVSATDVDATDAADAPATITKTKRVLVAAPRGYCAGVDRAVETVERALEKYGAPVYVRKEIVHNRYVVETLTERGAIFVQKCCLVKYPTHLSGWEVWDISLGMISSFDITKYINVFLDYIF